MNRFTGKVSGNYKKVSKPDIQAALTANLPAGTCLALSNEYYGDNIIVSTGVTGNLVLQHGFYPVAYIRPLTLTAALNGEAADSGQFTRVQQPIRDTCTNVIECDSVAELIDFVDTNQDFGK